MKEYYNQKTAWIFPFLLVLYEIPNYLSTDMFLPALPEITINLSTLPHISQQTIGIWFLGGACFQLLLGPLSDHFGRRPVLLIGAFCFVLASLGCALAPNIQILLLTRFIQGCSVGVIGTAGYATIHELYDQVKAIQVLAIMLSINVLAPALGPLAGSLVLLVLSWRWIFVILMLWALVIGLLLWCFMPETNPKFYLNKSDQNNLNLNHEVHEKAISVAQLLKNYCSLFLNPKFMLNNLIFCFAFLGLIAWLSSGPFLVEQNYGSQSFYFAIFQILIFGSLILGSLLVKILVTKVGHARLINLGLSSIFLGGCLGFLFPLFYPTFLFGIVISLMILSFGVALSFSAIHRIAIESCTEPMGARMAVFTTLISLSGFLGTLVVSLTYSENLVRFGFLLFVVSFLAIFTRLIVTRIK